MYMNCVLSSLWVTPPFCQIYELLLSNLWVSPASVKLMRAASFLLYLCLEMLAGFYSVSVFPISWMEVCCVLHASDFSEQVKLIAIIGRFCESSDYSAGGVLCLCVSVLSVWYEVKCYGEDKFLPSNCVLVWRYNARLYLSAEPFPLLRQIYATNITLHSKGCHHCHEPSKSREL